MRKKEQTPTVGPAFSNSKNAFTRVCYATAEETARSWETIAGVKYLGKFSSDGRRASMVDELCAVTEGSS